MVFRYSRNTLLRPVMILIMSSALMLGACGPARYRSAHHREGMSQLARHQPAEAAASFSAALNEAKAKGDPAETAQMMAILGWALGESGDFGAARRHLEEAIALAGKNGVDPSVMYARLAVVAAKSQDAETGMSAADRALTLTADRWRQRAGDGTRDAVIDYAVDHAGLPPDEEMIRAVIMSETAMAVLYLTTGDMPAAGLWADRALKHGESLGFVMNMAPAEDKLAFFQGTGVAAGVARAVADADGDSAAAAAFLETGRKAFAKIGIKVAGDDLLGAYLASGGGAAPVGNTTGGERFSAAYQAAMALWNDGKLSAAHEAFVAVAEAAGRDARRAEQIRALSQAGWIRAEQGRYAEALRSLSESIAVDPSSDETAMSLTRTAAIQARLGNAEKAMAAADAAMSVVTDTRPRLFQGKDREKTIDRFVKNPGLPPDVVLLKAVLGSEAARTVTYYFMGDYPRTATEGERALAHFTAAETAVGIAGRREQRDFYDGMGYTALAAGDALSFLGRTEDGRRLLKTAQEAFERSGSRFGSYAARALHACTYLREKRYRDGAGEMATIWSGLAKEGYDDILWRSRSRFAYYFDLHARELEAQLTASLGAPSSAPLTTVQRQWRDDTAGMLRDHLDALSPLLPNGQMDNALKALSRFETADTGADLAAAGRSVFRGIQQAALASYTAAIDHVESVRAMLETDLNKRAFRADKSIIYDGYIRLSTELNGAAAGLEALERAKARNLLDLLATREVSFKPSAETQTLGEIRQALTAAAEAPPADTRAATNAAMDAQAPRYRAIVVSARQRSPELASFLTVTYPLADEIRRMLPAGSAMLAYHLTDGDGIVFTVTSAGVTAEKIDQGRTALTPAVARLRRAIVARDQETVSATAAQLHQTLIPSSLNTLNISRLIISPDKVLFYLPFSALIENGQYLAARYSLSVTPSAGILRYALAKNRTTGGPMLALGNPDLGDAALDLPDAEQETLTVARLFPGSRALVRSAATESGFREQAKSYRILHLATHGEYASDDPLVSGLRLAPDARNDGHLQAGEIFSMDLDAALVVLSACQTGLGLVTEGGEIIGLTRAFLYAGTPSVVASLWSVDDTSTAMLMAHFYRNLKTMPRDEALRAAQENLIHGGDTAAPYYWAAFYLTGAW